MTAFLAGHVYGDVAALGRLEPRDGVLSVTAPRTPESATGVVLAELHARPGVDVEAGELLAITESASLLEALVTEAEAAVVAARENAEAANASAAAACALADVREREADRRESLRARQLSSIEETERAFADAEFQQASCRAADVSARAADAESGLAIARLARNRAALERAFVRAPIAGRVLDVHSWPGEMIGPSGILDLGAVNEMYAIGEVYETDIGRVRPGQRARITSDALPEPLTGVVEFVRPQVRKQDVLGTDPAARQDARVIEVEIRIENPSAVKDLTYLQVEIVIAGSS
ncbi:MAG: efflux RND transporter periplasmic adaptor subunit [Pseudomonadales bacterium]|nr:efflux RND transporter periplasmic adaptor subunit [Pseudomonadales bacterium]